MTNVKHAYETVMIFNTQVGEEGIKALIEKFKGLIAENGTIDSEEDWGKRRLAYPIMDENEGYYYKVNFSSEAEFPAELDRVYKITEGVLRTMIIRLEEESGKDRKKRIAKEAAVAAAAAAAVTPAVEAPVQAEAQKE